jgi:hypothetical protein
LSVFCGDGGVADPDRMIAKLALGLLQQQPTNFNFSGQTV